MAAKHTIFFIHGMGDNQPRDGFQFLWAGIRKAYGNRPGATTADFDARYEPGYVDWHWVTRAAKLELFREAFHGTDPQELTPTPARHPISTARSLLHPTAAARTFVTFFLGDVIAYVTENDNSIRRSVWAAMKPKLSSGGAYSIVAHSLGSVIAFDYLFQLYDKQQLFWPVEDPEADVTELQARFYGLFTLGSPVGLFMMRQGELWNAGEPAAGAAPMFTEIRNPLPRADQVWLNFWDKQDVIAFPLERLFAHNLDYNRDRPLADREVTTGWNWISAHLGYWRDAGVAREIAEALP